jgi:hypothetical protein
LSTGEEPHVPEFQRIDYPPNHGVFDCNLQWPAVQSDSFVVATVSERHSEGVLAGGHDASRFLGAASLSVLNVVPHAGGVTVRLHIDWGDPLPYAVDFILFD